MFSGIPNSEPVHRCETLRVVLSPDIAACLLLVYLLRAGIITNEMHEAKEEAVRKRKVQNKLALASRLRVHHRREKKSDIHRLSLALLTQLLVDAAIMVTSMDFNFYYKR